MEHVAGVPVSRETLARLEAFAAITLKWTPKINLIAKGTTTEIWDRHIVDSAQLYALAPSEFEHWVDIGSGGGFPGIVMAILGHQHHPDARFTLIESDQRKCTFLRTAARELSLSVNVIANRIEAAAPQEADVVSARALAALPALLPLVHRHLAKDGVCLIHKGRNAASEIAQAQETWSFALEDQPSITDPEARLLSIRRILQGGT
ncbi:16S rRNA (guanine(527)-N(7))-methyltransferase RsmG [Yoonia litorea]|uniref:Ribosomal RNA small subunit methyltransferase G n=1 Tax=Yoonia litorea TaxID=1123755 RepID=A0A1I6MW49_9RHOB|nr:16S rRNA m(7)G-527 methyltransferase [Yoonia litorea]